MLNWLRKSKGARLDTKDLAQCYARIFQSAAGERVLEDLSRRSVAVRVDVTAGPDALQRKEGERDLFAHILNRIDAGRRINE